MQKYTRTVKKHKSGAVLFAVFLFFALFYFLICASDGFVSFLLRFVSPYVRYALYFITSPFPFSLFEIIVALAVLYLLFLIGFLLFYLIRPGKRNKKAKDRLLFTVPVVLTAVFGLFCLSFAPCYRDVPVAEKMDIDTDIDKEKLFRAAGILKKKTEEALSKLSVNADQTVECPYTFEEINEKVAFAANEFAKEYEFYQSGINRAKPFLSSKPMTYTHISGVYGFFTGEANVNTNYPELIRSMTVAHELSHARGIAPENECNFLAFVITGFYSDDPYLNYCAYSYVFDELLSAMRKTDKKAADEFINSLPEPLFADWRSFNAFLDDYDSPPVAEAAGKINSAYLVSQGQKNGTLSYSMTVELVTGYVLK